MRQQSFTLIELLCVIAIAAISYTLATPSLRYLIYVNYARLTIHQIEQAINYGRSQAIAYKGAVTLCPSHNRRSCGGSWHQGILVVSPNGQKCYFKVFVDSWSMLSLSQSGASGHKMRIEANGLTHFNGSFNYKSLKFGDFPQFKLYFNKGLRIYEG